MGFYVAQGQCQIYIWAVVQGPPNLEAPDKT